MCRKKISIITINYNNFDGLRRTLESVAGQAGAKFEHIVIDGLSNDGSQKLVNSYQNLHGNSAKVIEEDSGIYDAMNKGLGLASGDYVAFLNSGDVLPSSDTIFRCSAILDEYPTALYGDIDFVDAHMRVVREWKSGRFLRSKLLWGWMPPHPMLFIKRSALIGSGGFDTSYTIAADYKLLLSILSKPSVKVRYTGFKVARMEVGGLSNGSLKAVAQSNLQVVRAWIQVNRLPALWLLFTKPFSKLFQLRKGY